MKLLTHIKKLFDAENSYRRLEKKMAKENANKCRGTTPNPRMHGLRHLYSAVFGYTWWRGWRGRGKKSAQGRLLPQTRTDIQEER